jgi:hypothetical protein
MEVGRRVSFPRGFGGGRASRTTLRMGWSWAASQMWILAGERMKLPPDVEFHEDVRLVVWRPRGVLNRAAVNRIITVIGELEATLKEPFNRFADTLQADAVDLNIEYLIRVFLYRRFFYGKRPPVKAAVLATHSTIVHYARLHAILTHGSPINVRIFQDRKEAAQWLGVPVELLAAKNSSVD